MKTCTVDRTGLMDRERDACAIICYVNKAGKPTHGNLQRTIEALVKMGHRAGEINGEGDGCGVLTDIPRPLWKEILLEAGKDPDLAESPSFAVGHFLVPTEVLAANPGLQEEIIRRFTARGVDVLVERPGLVRSEVLATNARRGEPFFWQVALTCRDARKAPSLLYVIKSELEQDFPIHV
ncbi:MAG: glutamate synthase, partial [Geobacteraceae bacterium]|nr:glutamate synthase [Geobacteraceae bacterium]